MSHSTPATASSGRGHDTLCWPGLGLPADLPTPSPACRLAMQVCDALERRLERLAAHPLPSQVAEDLMDMWHDLEHAQRLLAEAPHGQGPGRAQRLLADLQAWLPVCETWIGVVRQPAAWPVLLN